MFLKNFTSSWAIAAINVAIILLVGLALYITHSLWSFIGLIFLMEGEEIKG